MWYLITETKATTSSWRPVTFIGLPYIISVCLSVNAIFLAGKDEASKKQILQTFQLGGDASGSGKAG